jgi:hypothetical protein
MRINWVAVDRAACYHRLNQQALGDYQAWILAEGGIDHGQQHIRIVDEALYLSFVLRWA